jgi:diguanylate cyclase (GGDEF)-like protein/PAS domain S-box-containing protein
MQTPTRAFQALHEVAVAAAGLRDPNALAALVVDRARDLLEADAAALYWFFPEKGTLRTLAHNDPREEGPEPPFNPGEGAAGRAYSEATPVRVDDYRGWSHALPSSVGRGIESGLAVPLMVSHRAVGSLGVFNRRTREWSADDEQLLVLFAAQVAPAMEAARLTEETIEQAHNFRALHEIAIAAGGLRDLAELGRLVVDRARQLLKSESATLRWWDPGTSSLRLLASIPVLDASAERIGVGEGALGEAFERQEPAVIENYGKAQRTVAWAVKDGIKSALGVPVMAREEPLGALGVATYSDRHYTRQEVQLLTLLAAQVGPALEAARLYHESERRRREAEALAELVRQGAGQEDSERAIAMIAEQACRLVGADYSVVVLVNSNGDLEVKGHHGTRSAIWKSGVRLSASGHAARVIEKGRSVALGTIDPDDNWIHQAEGGQSAIGTPLREGERQVGALILGWRNALEPMIEQIQLAEAVAGYAATIIDNVGTHERERRLAIEAAARSTELAAVIDHIPDGVYVADLEGRIVLMNPAGNAMMGGRGSSGGDISGGIGAYTILDPKTRQPVPRKQLAMSRALRGEKVSRVESIVQREGTADIWLESSAVPLHNAEGMLTGALVVFSDVTRERSLVGELAASEERFRSLYGMVACGVLVQDSKGRVIDANAPAEAILGWSLAEMRGKKTGILWAAITEEGKPVPQSQRPTMHALRSGQPKTREVLGIKRRTGDVKWVQIDTVPVLNPDGSPRQVVSSFIDITERKVAEQRLAESEAKYRLLFDRNPEAMWVREAGSNRFLAVNDTAVERYGYSREEFLAMSLEVIQPPEELAGMAEARGAEDSYSGPSRHRRRNGTIISVEVSSHRLEFDGLGARLVIATDVSERKRVQDQLAESELKLRTIFDQAPIGLARVDLEGKIQEANLSLRTMLGYAEGATPRAGSTEQGRAPSTEQLVGLRFDRLLYTPGGSELDLIRDFLKGDRDHYTAELPVRRRDGTQRWGSVSLSLVRGADREPLYLIGMLEDISDRKAQTELLEYQALHDSLTDLPNRTLLHDRLQQAILTAQREHRQLALLIMDLNRFKEVNDTFGHHLGDILLQQVGPRIMAQLRESDTVARLGGDEFAVVLPTADDEAGATLAARRLLKALEEPFVIEDRRLEVGGSIGIAITPQHGADPATLMRRADIAMYVAKRTRSGYTVYAPEHDKHSPGRLSLMGELRDALQGDALVLHYQPQVSLPAGTVVGVEALIRWQHPRHGLMPPDEFLTIAEETGLIVGVSEWALNAALEQSRSWSGRAELPVAVNVSMQNLQDEDLPALLATLLERHSIRPERLKIEVTETALMADPQRSAEIFAQLREMGVKVSVDDFGSGYSSLAYLKQLPVDELKIDRSFVIGITPSAEEIAIIRSAVEIGHSLGLTVVAEGVETQAAWDILAELGCDAAQGYLITRPLPARQLGRWLSAGWAPRAHEPAS